MDLVSEVDGAAVPFEVKYRSQHTGLRGLKDLLELCSQKKIERDYVVKRVLDDFGVMGDAATDGCKT